MAACDVPSVARLSHRDHMQRKMEDPIAVCHVTAHYLALEDLVEEVQKAININ